MRIILISPCHKNFGGWYRTHNIAKELASLGHKVDFYYYLSYQHNFFFRCLRGLVNITYLFRRYELVYIFEIVQPETFFSALLARLLGKRVIIDIADEWLYSPTYQRSNPLIKTFINLLDTRFIRLFTYFTVTSEYLMEKIRFYHPRAKILKLINGCSKWELYPVEKKTSRNYLGFTEKDKVVLSFGNTFGEERKYWLEETCRWLNKFDPEIKIIKDRYFEKGLLTYYLSACDMVLFPTGDNPCERACFPIRVGTCLNAGRIIATDTSSTEFHNTLEPFNCIIQGETPEVLARNMISYFGLKIALEKLEQNVLRAKEELGWDRLIKRLEDFYK